MTEILSTQTQALDPADNTPKPIQTDTTRAFLEKNWDLLVSETEPQSPLTEETKTPTSNASCVENQLPQTEDFNPLAHLDKAYEELKPMLIKKGLSSKEEWIKALVQMDKLYHQTPDLFFKALQEQGASSPISPTSPTPPIPSKSDAPLQAFDLTLLKEKVIQQGLLSLLGQKNASPQEVSQIPPSFPETQNAFFKTQPLNLQNANPFMANFGQTSPFNPQDTRNINSIYGLNQATLSTPPLGTDVNTLLKELIQKEVSSLVQKTNETQKAKDASFNPKSTKPLPQTSQTHTPSGRLKTTREILEEGCRLFGI